MARTPTRFHVALIALLAWAAVLYGPLRHAPFVYEDAQYFGAESSTWGWETITFRQPSRTLTMATYGWVHRAWLFEPGAQHITNVSIHLVNGVLVYVLAVAVSQPPAVALGAAGLFLLHPFNSQAVSYVAARPDVLSATFILAAMLAILARRRRWLWWPVSIVFMIAASAAKDTGVAVVLLALVTLLCWRRHVTPWGHPVLAGLWIVLGAGIGMNLIRILDLIALAGAGSSSGMHVQPLEYITWQMTEIWDILRVAVQLDTATIEHDALQRGLVGAMAAWALTGVVAAAAVVYWRRQPIVTWTVTWIAAALMLRFVVQTNEFVQEQHLYAASIGLWIGVASLAFSGWQSATRVVREHVAFWQIWRVGTYRLKGA